MASENLSLTLLAGEHALCESARAARACASARVAKARVKKDTSGKDGYQREQDFFWIPSTKNNGEDMCVINYLRHGKKIVSRSEERDRQSIEETPCGDYNQVKHKWWIPPPNRHDCLAHFVNECLQSNSDPFEMMHSSSKGSTSSSEKEKKSCWTKYVTKKSNKINIDALPLAIRTMEANTCERKVRKRKAAGVMKTGTELHSDDFELETTSKKEVPPSEEISNDPPSFSTTSEPNTAIANEHRRKRRKKPKNKANKGSIGNASCATIDLYQEARKAWEERYGSTRLPPISAFGDSYGGIGLVWTQAVHEPGMPTLYTTTEYPPSVLDESFITLEDDEGVAFTNKKMAKHALLWWIICTIPTRNNILRWSDNWLQEKDSVVLVVANYSADWCTLLRDENGSVCVEYNGRRRVLAHKK
jgi:hypothetical protein